MRGSFLLFPSEVGWDFAPSLGIPFQNRDGNLMGAEPVLCAGYDLMELRGLGSMLQFGLALFLFYPQLGIHAVAIDYLVSNPPLFHQGKGVDYGEELADIIGAVKWTVVENLCSRLQVYALVFHRTGIAGTGCIYSPGICHYFIGQW